MDNSVDSDTENVELHLYGAAAAHAIAVIEKASEISEAIQLAMNEAWRPGESQALEALQELVDRLDSSVKDEAEQLMESRVDEDDEELETHRPGPR